jgi:hypothetical protein
VLYYCIVVTVLTPQPRKPHTCNNINNGTGGYLSDIAVMRTIIDNSSMGDDHLSSDISDTSYAQ